MSKKILIVDDNPENREAVVLLLHQSEPQYNVLTASNGVNGYDIACAECPDLIIMDWEMPMLNGIECIKKLKQNEDTKEIPVIMFTGAMTSNNDLKTALEAGAIDFIRKPADVIELIARINSMLLLTSYFKKKNEAEKKYFEIEIEKNLAEINFRKNELTSNALMLAKKNEKLIDVVRDLEKFLEKSGGTDLTLIKSIINSLNFEINSDDYWENFTEKFSITNGNFNDRLLQKHPDLTKTELKMCYFLKMNLSSKDIANIMNISVEGVEKTRYRLRKKMNLNHDQSLDGYVNGI